MHDGQFSCDREIDVIIGNEPLIDFNDDILL